MTVFFTLADGDDAFKWHADIPIMPEDDIQVYLESQIETLRCGIYRKQFREAQIAKLEGEMDLEAWQRWEAEGCRNVSIVALPVTNDDISEVDDPSQGQEPETTTTYTVIEKKAWRDMH